MPIAPAHPSTPASSGRWRRWCLHALGPGLIALLLLLYLASPRFYLTYVLEYRQRETQAVELVTVLSAMLGGLLLLRAAWLCGRRGPRTSTQRRRAAALLIGTIGLAALFFAGEEISWGQTWLGWETPQAYRAVSGETNLHNAAFKVQSLGSLFLVLVFFVLPAVWALPGHSGIPATWSCAIAEGPVVSCMTAGFAWRFFKDIYRACIPEGGAGSDLFYRQFVEQIGEQKELLVALALLLYGLYRAAAVRRARASADGLA